MLKNRGWPGYEANVNQEPKLTRLTSGLTSGVKEGFKEAILSFQKIGLEPGVDVVMLDNHADKNQRSYRVLFMQEAVAFQWSITTK